jgi:cytochrome P450
LLATQFKDFGKGELFRRMWYDLLGNSIFSTDGAMWHSSRQLVRPLFIKDRVSDLHTFEKHSQTLISKLPIDGSTVDISDLFFKATLDTATDFLLGYDVDSLNNPDERFAEAFGEVQRMQMQLVDIP